MEIAQDTDFSSDYANSMINNNQAHDLVVNCDELTEVFQGVHEQHYHIELLAITNRGVTEYLLAVTYHDAALIDELPPLMIPLNDATTTSYLFPTRKEALQALCACLSDYQ